MFYIVISKRGAIYDVYGVPRYASRYTAILYILQARHTIVFVKYNDTRHNYIPIRGPIYKYSILRYMNLLCLMILFFDKKKNNTNKPFALRVRAACRARRKKKGRPSWFRNWDFGFTFIYVCVCLEIAKIIMRTIAREHLYSLFTASSRASSSDRLHAVRSLAPSEPATLPAQILAPRPSPGRAIFNADSVCVYNIWRACTLSDQMPDRRRLLFVCTRVNDVISYLYARCTSWRREERSTGRGGVILYAHNDTSVNVWAWKDFAGKAYDEDKSSGPSSAAEYGVGRRLVEGGGGGKWWERRMKKKR